MRTGVMIIFNMIHVSCECITKLNFKEPCTNFNPAYKTMIHNRPSFHYSLRFLSDNNSFPLANLGRLPDAILMLSFEMIRNSEVDQMF